VKRTLRIRVMFAVLLPEFRNWVGVIHLHTSRMASRFRRNAAGRSGCACFLGATLAASHILPLDNIMAAKYYS
jgi:hypothetical protein